MRVLLLGGTTEASRLAHMLAEAGVNTVFSYAGRTKAPIQQPLPQRIGGFGGVEGLAGYLQAEAITHVIDATHPFAAQISKNILAACQVTKTPFLTLERPGWKAQTGDSWTMVPDFQDAAKALPERPSRVFLAIGRQNLEKFSQLRHQWLLRLVTSPDPSMPLPGADVVVARGPFTATDDEALLLKYRITHIVTKNSGGSGGEAKLIAARRLNLPVVMIDRPEIPSRPTVQTPEEVMTWLHQTSQRGV